MKISGCRWGLAGLFVITAAFISGTVSIQAAASPDPWMLLQGLHSTRMQIPPSSLKLQITYINPLVTNVLATTVDFDGERRSFNHLNPSPKNRGWESIFDGTRAITYDRDLNQVSYRTLATQNGAKLFDPRVLGLVSLYSWRETLDSRFPSKASEWTAEVIGREAITGRPAWRVRTRVNNLEIDYWIDETAGFRLDRFDLNGVQTVSYYDNSSYPWLPSRVVSKTYKHLHPPADEVPQDTRIVEVLEARSNVKFPKDRWTLAAMTIKPGADIVDHGLQRSVGHWNGKRVVPVQGDVKPAPKFTAGFLILISAALCAPFLFLRRRGKATGLEGSRAEAEQS